MFCGVIAFAIALSMLLRGRRMVHWLFAAFSVCIALWYASQSLADLVKATIYVRGTGVLTVLLPQFAAQLFESILPDEAQAKKRSTLPRIAFLTGLPLLALVLSPYHEAPITLGLVYFYVFGFLAAALTNLWKRGQRSRSRSARDRVRFLVVVGALATTFQLADFLSFLGVYLPPIGAVLAVVFLFVLAESLTRQRLADLYELAGRLLVATALAFALAGIFYVFITYIGRFGTMYLNAVLAAIVFLVLFEPLEQQVETRIHQFFFRERYDLDASVSELRRRLAHALESDEMVTLVLGGLEVSRRVTSCAVYLRDAEDASFELAGSFGGAAPKRVSALALRPILERLSHGPVSLEEAAIEAIGERDGEREALAPLLTAAEELGLFSSAVLLGVMGEGEQVIGLVCVADERVRDAFTPEEIALLDSVATQMGVALANSRLYARMKERDRLAALGALAAGLAHEVKNPLGAIKGAAQLLEEGEAAGDPSTQEFIGIILEETNRLNNVVGSFLDYARPQAGNPVPLDVNAAVRRTVQIVTNQQPEGVAITLELAEQLPRVKIDPEKLRQVIMNLIQNAVQAMAGDGTVTVSTSLRGVPRDHWKRRSTRDSDPGRDAAISATESVEISVHDTGPGINQKVLKNLFVPFFTTKEKGTGLGLAISQSIVQNAGGSIQVSSPPGAGTRFVITLPAAAEVSTPAPTEAVTKDALAAAAAAGVMEPPAASE